MEELKPCHTYNPCDECPYGIEKREGNGDDSECKICEFAKLLNRRASPENRALTIEELKQMDGKPVWVVPTNYWYYEMLEIGAYTSRKENPAKSEWGLINWKDQKILTSDNCWYDICWYGSDYSKGGKFVAYRQKPVKAVAKKEADIPGSQEIRDSCDTEDGMCARAAKRISEEITIPEDNTQTPKEQADMINNYKQMSQALKKQKEQNVQMRKMLDRLKKALGVACSMQLDRILPSDIKAVVNIVLQEAEKYDSTLVEGLCCDCFYDKKGFCGDYSENDNCHYKKKDGSCWKPHK